MSEIFRFAQDDEANSHSEPLGEESLTPHKKPSFRGRRLLRLALNGYTQIQIEKILFPIMNFRFSPSARLAEESHVSLVRDISLSLNMTEYFSHSVLRYGICQF